MAELFREGLFVQFSCSLAAITDESIIQIRAVFHMTKDLGTTLKPVVRAEEDPNYIVKLEEHPSSSKTKREFDGEFEVRRVSHGKGTLNLLLQVQPSAKSIARSEIHIFTDTELASAAEEASAANY